MGMAVLPVQLVDCELSHPPFSFLNSNCLLTEARPLPSWGAAAASDAPRSQPIIYRLAGRPTDQDTLRPAPSDWRQQRCCPALSSSEAEESRRWSTTQVVRGFGWASWQRGCRGAGKAWIPHTNPFPIGSTPARASTMGEKGPTTQV